MGIPILDLSSLFSSKSKGLLASPWEVGAENDARNGTEVD